MPVILMTILKGLISEFLVKRLAYVALKALAKSTKNELDDEAVHVIGQALGLEEK